MSLSSALHIGRTALTAGQLGVNVTGHNLANAANRGYSRQSVGLHAMAGTNAGSNAFLGRGVGISGVQRQVDDALMQRLWGSNSDNAAAERAYRTLSMVESTLNELSGHDLSSQLNKFQNAWSELANLTGSSAVVVQQGEQLAGFVRSMRGELERLRDQTDQELASAVRQAGQLTEEIASINREIVRTEVGSKGANELRDRRDELLGDLSKLMDISAVEQANGTVNVLVGSTPLVLEGQAREVALQRETVDGILEVSVTVGERGKPLNIRSGEIGAMLTEREEAVTGTLREIDSVASALIFEVNKLHSTGSNAQGLRRTQSQVAFPPDQRQLALNDPDNSIIQNLPFSPRTGGFTVNLTQGGSGTSKEIRIPVDLDGLNADGTTGTQDDTSAEDIRAALDGIDGLRASFSPEGRLVVEAEDGFEFSFSDDSSGVLGVLGVNAYFTGTDARDIGIRDDLRSDPSRLTAGRVVDGEFEENGTAMAIAGVRDRAMDSLGGRSIAGRWSDAVQTVGTRTASAQTQASASAAVKENLEAQRQSISGVNTDEEAINLMNFQRQYQSGARLINVADEMIQTLLSLV